MIDEPRVVYRGEYDVSLESKRVATDDEFARALEDGWRRWPVAPAEPPVAIVAPLRRRGRAGSA